MTKPLAAVLVLTAVLAAAAPAFAQGCVACRTSAAAGGEQAANAFDIAILVLLIPTISIFVGVFFYAFRYRNRSLADQTQPDDEVTPPPSSFDDAAFLRSLRPR